jgi:hypothetical protein
MDRRAYGELRAIAADLSALNGRRVTNSEALREIIRAAGTAPYKHRPAGR